MNRIGVKVSIQGNVLYCNQARTREANWVLVMYALSLILDSTNLIPPEQTQTIKPIQEWQPWHLELMGGKVEYYSSRGDGQ